MKNVIIIHGCPSNIEKAMDPVRRTYDKHWMPWLKKNLEKVGIPCLTPFMPEPWNPDYEKFKAEFEKFPVNTETILVGHSCGCAFLVRWLSESKQKVAKLILVAPWKIARKGQKLKAAFYNYPIDQTTRDQINEVDIFTADDEEEAGKKSAEIFHQALGGKIVELHDHGHYTLDDMGTEEFPELLRTITE